jgi:hypothetical protein
MGEFDEIDAMKTVGQALEPLTDVERRRVLHWAHSRYGTGQSREGVAAPSGAISYDTDKVVIAHFASHKTFAELFDAANPTSEKDKALVAAYWVQVCSQFESFAAQTLNGELKDLGHGVSNITESLTRLKNDRPALILQLKKSGTSKQARKTYKLTQEGLRRVETMFNTPAVVSEGSN